MVDVLKTVFAKVNKMMAKGATGFNIVADWTTLGDITYPELELMEGLGL